MSELLIVEYRDAFAVSRDDRMLIYGLTFEEAKDFRNMYYLSITDGQFTPAGGARPAHTADRRHGGPKKRGRKLLLEPFRPKIEAYLDTSEAPTIKELDDILLKEGASYSSTMSIRNMLHSLGRDIPWTNANNTRASVCR